MTAQGVTDSGTLVVTGTTTISSATFDVVLNEAANNFGGAVSVTAKDVTLVDTNAIILGASTVTGNLNVTAQGVTDSGTLVVTGTTTISSATFDVVLDDTANNFGGAVSVTAKDVTLVDTNAIILGASTVTGNLNVTAQGVTDSGTLVVTGTTTISSATFDVVLDDTANNFGGAVSVTAKDVTLVDTNAIILGASTVTGNLNVTAQGVTDSGTLVVTGTTTISSATFDVVLNEAANNFGGAVSVTAKDVTLVDTNAIILVPDGHGKGNLNVTAKGVTDTGTLSVTGTTTISSGTFDVVLDDAANNFTGAVSVISGKDVVLTDVNDLNLGLISISGTLSVNAANVDLSASVTTGGNFNVNVGTGTVSVAGASDETVAVNVGPGTFKINSGATLALDINGSGASLFDQLNVTGVVDISGVVLSATGSIGSVVGQAITIVNNDVSDAITGTFAGLLEGSTVAINGTIS